MFNGKPVIDVHGHMSVPPQFRAFAYNLVALRSPGDELFDFLTTEDKTAIVTDNPLRVFPLLAKSPALQTA